MSSGGSRVRRSRRRSGGERKTTENWIDEQTQSRERRRRIRDLRRRRWSASFFDRKSKEVASQAANVAYRAMIDAVYALQGCQQFVKLSESVVDSKKSTSKKNKKYVQIALTDMEATVSELALWIAKTLYVSAGATRDGSASVELLETACSIHLDSKMGLLSTWVYFHIPPLLRRYQKKKKGSHTRMTSKLQSVLDIDTFVEAVKIELRLSRVFMIACEGIESWSFHPLPRGSVHADILSEACRQEDSRLGTHVRVISGLDMFSFLRKHNTRSFTMPEFCATFNRPAPATRRVLNVYDYKTGLLISYDPERGVSDDKTSKSKMLEKWNTLLGDNFDDDDDDNSSVSSSQSFYDENDEVLESYHTPTPQDCAAKTIQKFMKKRFLHIKGWTHIVNKITRKVEWYSDESNRVVKNRPDPILKEPRPERSGEELWTQLRRAVVLVSNRVRLMKMCCKPIDLTSFRAKWSRNEIQFRDMWNGIGYEKEAKRWLKCAHGRSGRMYYFNLITEESSWGKPDVIEKFETLKHRIGIAHIVRRHLREQLAEGKEPKLENVPHAVLDSSLLTDMFEGFHKDFEELCHRVEDGSIRAAIILARSCLEGFCTSKHNVRVACNLLEIGARRGCAKSQTILAGLLAIGQGAIEPARADRWAATALDNGLEDAADDGHPVARLGLGLMLQNGIGVGSKNYRAAAQMYESVISSLSHCSKQVLAEASCRLAWCCQHGLGVEKSLPRAVKLYRVAIRDANMLEAIEALATVLQSHDGRDKTVRANDDEAAQLWREAAARGSANGMMHYGKILLQQIEDDESVDPKSDTFLAATLFSHAMQRGEERALDALKKMIASGTSRKAVGESALRDMIRNVKLPELNLRCESASPSHSTSSANDHILVSYERSDAEISAKVREIVSKLSETGFRVRTVAPKSNQLGRVITEECCAILLFVNRKYGSSRRCIQELFQADSRNLVLVPVVLDEMFDLEEMPSLNFVLRAVKMLKCDIRAIVNRLRREGVPCPDEEDVELAKHGPPRRLSLIRDDRDEDEDDDSDSDDNHSYHSENLLQDLQRDLAIQRKAMARDDDWSSVSSFTDAGSVGF